VLLEEALALVRELSTLRDVRLSPVICHTWVSGRSAHYVYGDRNSRKRTGESNRNGAVWKIALKKCGVTLLKRSIMLIEIGTP
jgi:hypothetical protein